MPEQLGLAGDRVTPECLPGLSALPRRTRIQAFEGGIGFNAQQARLIVGWMRCVEAHTMFEKSSVRKRSCRVKRKERCARRPNRCISSASNVGRVDLDDLGLQAPF